jgi:hypothetical protein
VTVCLEHCAQFAFDASRDFAAPRLATVIEAYDRIERGAHDRPRSQISAVLKVFQIAFRRAVDPFPIGANLCGYFSKTTISHLDILKIFELTAGF